MTADRRDSGLHQLSDELISVLFEFLPVYDLYHCMTTVCHRFAKLLLHEPMFMSRLAQRRCGISKTLPKEWLKQVHRELVQTDLQADRLLQFQGAQCSIDCYLHQAKYQVENMFVYSPSQFVAGGSQLNALAKAVFTGAYESEDKFKQDVHEDVFWVQHFAIPSQYRYAKLVDDNFLSNKHTRSVLDVYQGNEFQTTGSLALTLAPVETTPPLGVKSALISRIGIGRPIFTPHPVRTLLISTRLPTTNTTDFKALANLDSLEKVKKFDERKIETIHTNHEVTVIEFEGTEGPLLWVQFQDYLLVQTEVVLHSRRRATHLEVLLIDSEDRKEFGGTDKGVAICYVAATGWAVESLGLV